MTMPPVPPILNIGSRVTLTARVRNLERFHNKHGEITLIVTSTNIQVANVLFDAEEEGGVPCLARDIPLPYLRPEVVRTGVKPKRRGALNLHAPADTRTEAQKQAECAAWLTGLGYAVLGVGQHRSQAVCWACTNAQRAQGHSPLVKVFCPSCRRPVYSPDTGSSEGYPDISVRHETRWQPGAVLLLEWKRDAKANRRARQVELCAAGWSYIVSSLAEAAGAIVRFERDVLQLHRLAAVESIAVFRARD